MQAQPGAETKKLAEFSNESLLARNKARADNQIECAFVLVGWLQLEDTHTETATPAEVGYVERQELIAIEAVSERSTRRRPISPMNYKPLRMSVCVVEMTSNNVLLRRSL